MGRKIGTKSRRSRVRRSSSPSRARRPASALTAARRSPAPRGVRRRAAGGVWGGGPGPPPPPPPPPRPPAPKSLGAAEGEEDGNKRPPLAGGAFELAEQRETARQCPYCGETLPGSRKVNFCPQCGQPPSGELRCPARSEEHTSELQSRLHLVCRLLLEKKKKIRTIRTMPTVSTIS